MKRYLIGLLVLLFLGMTAMIMCQNWRIEKLKTKMLLEEMSESPSTLTIIEKTVKDKTETERSDIGEGLWGSD